MSTTITDTDRARGWSLEGKSGVVTGAASGLGKESARLLAQRGARVLLADINPGALDATTKSLRDEGLDVASFVADFSDAAQIKAALEESITRFGTLDFLHNNAGALVARPLLEVEPGDLDLMLNLNVRGVFWSCRYAVEIMRSLGRGGSIVNTASILAHRGDPVLPVYTATKHAVLGLTKAIAIDPAVARARIRVNCVSPGDMDTPLNDRYFDSLPDPVLARAELEATYPGGRMAHPVEMATAVAFLVSEDASFISGTSMVVDAGLTANPY